MSGSTTSSRGSGCSATTPSPANAARCARYQLVDSADSKVLLDATAGSDAGIDVVSSEYATIAAEQTALENLARVVADQIVTKVSLRLRNP